MVSSEKHQELVAEHQLFLAEIDQYQAWLATKLSLSAEQWAQARYIVAAFGVGGRSFQPTATLMFLAARFIPYDSYNFKSASYDTQLFEAVFLLQFALHKQYAAAPITRTLTRESLWSISVQVRKLLEKISQNR